MLKSDFYGSERDKIVHEVLHKLIVTDSSILDCYKENEDINIDNYIREEIVRALDPEKLDKILEEYCYDNDGGIVVRATSEDFEEVKDLPCGEDEILYNDHLDYYANLEWEKRKRREINELFEYLREKYQMDIEIVIKQEKPKGIRTSLDKNK